MLLGILCTTAQDPGSFTCVLTAAYLSNLDYADVMRSILGVERVVFYVNKERARRHPWVVGAFCGLWQADIYCPLTPGHETEQPDSKHTMILIPSSSARLGHTLQEGHNAKNGIDISLWRALSLVAPILIAAQKQGRA